MRLTKQPLIHDLNALARVGSGDVGWHGVLERRLPGLGDLEGAEHHEDCTPPLHGADPARHVGTAVADAVDMVENRHSFGGTEEEVALRRVSRSDGRAQKLCTYMERLRGRCVRGSVLCNTTRKIRMWRTCKLYAGSTQRVAETRAWEMT